MREKLSLQLQVECAAASICTVRLQVMTEHSFRAYTAPGLHVRSKEALLSSQAHTIISHNHLNGITVQKRLGDLIVNKTRLYSPNPTSGPLIDGLISC